MTPDVAQQTFETAALSYDRPAKYWLEGELLGRPCRVESTSALRVSSNGAEVQTSIIRPGLLEFATQVGQEYILSA